jgi:hypothetical protein
LIIESFEEVKNVNRVDEVDESIPHVASVLEVDGEVEKVILVLGVPVDSLQQHFLGVFIRDVSDHNRSSQVIPRGNALEVEVEVCRLRLLLDWI